MAGHKIENVFPGDGTFAVPAVTAVVNGSKSPNAAKLLAEYTLSLEAERQLRPRAVDLTRMLDRIQRDRMAFAAQRTAMDAERSRGGGSLAGPQRR